MSDDSASQSTKIELLRKAVATQSKFRLEATMGKGCDRHLLALMCAAAVDLDMDMPQMFKDKASVCAFNHRFPFCDVSLVLF